MKQWWLVLIPALITAFAGLTPVIYEHYRKWSGDLNYEVVSGPSLRSGNELKRVTSITVRNSGSSKVSNVIFRYHTTEKIEEHAVQDKSKVVSKAEVLADALVISVAAMHPSEQFSTALLLSSPASAPQNIGTEILLRGDETLGYEKTIKNAQLPVFLSSFAAGLAVIAMSLLTLGATRRFGISAQRLLGIRSPTERREVLLFVTRVFNLRSLERTVVVARPEVMYREFGSIVLAFAFDKSDAVRHNAAAALSSLLLISTINTSSRQSLESAITSLEPNEWEDVKFEDFKRKAVELKSIDEFRDAVLAIKNSA